MMMDSINEHLDIVIIDFGLSITKNELKTEKRHHKYNVQTIWYRAPEIYLELEYTEAIDMWSLGCIAYELYWHKPLFNNKTIHGLFVKQNILLDAPPSNILKNIDYIDIMYDDIESPEYIADLKGTMIPLKHKQFIKEHDNNPRLLEFILKCCCWDHHKRLTPSEAISMLKLIGDFY